MGVNLKQLADSSMGLEGAAKGSGEFMFINVPYNTTSPLTLSHGIVSRACQVQSIMFCPDVASTNAATATVFQAASTVALGAGTALHSGTLNLQAVAGTNVLPTLSTVAGALSVAAGSRIGIVIGGALGAAGNGVVTIGMTPA